MKPDVSIVIPTYNGALHILKCLEAIDQQNTSRSFEVIVVNDGSSDNTIEIVDSKSEVRLISQDNAGPAAARNRGVLESSAEIIVFTDDDCVPTPNWLEEMLVPFADPNVVGVKGAYLTSQDNVIARFVQIEYEEKYNQLSQYDSINLVDTYSAAFRRKVFIDSGGYDDSFPTASVEDRDFSYRLSNLNLKMVFAPSAKVFHTHVDTLMGYIKKKYKNGYWGMVSILKYPSILIRSSDTPRTQKFQILLMAIGIPLCVGSVLTGYTFLALATLSAAFLVTTIPFLLRCFRSDRGIVLWAPFFLACRTLGLALGFLAGFARCKLGTGNKVSGKFLQGLLK